MVAVSLPAPYPEFRMHLTIEIKLRSARQRLQLALNFIEDDLQVGMMKRRNTYRFCQRLQPTFKHHHEMMNARTLLFQRVAASSLPNVSLARRKRSSHFWPK